MAEADAISRLNASIGVVVQGSSIVEPVGFHGSLHKSSRIGITSDDCEQLLSKFTQNDQALVVVGVQMSKRVDSFEISTLKYFPHSKVQLQRQNSILPK